jgi:hypothetical protein
MAGTFSAKQHPILREANDRLRLASTEVAHENVSNPHRSSRHGTGCFLGIGPATPRPQGGIRHSRLGECERSEERDAFAGGRSGKCKTMSDILLSGPCIHGQPNVQARVPRKIERLRVSLRWSMRSPQLGWVDCWPSARNSRAAMSRPRCLTSGWALPIFDIMSNVSDRTVMRAFPIAE